MRLYISYSISPEHTGFNKYIDVPLTYNELCTKFGIGDPLIRPRTSREYQNLVRWLMNNYVPDAYSIDGISRID